MSKESLSVKDFSWKQQLGDHSALEKFWSKESLSVKDFSWKQQLGDHQALWRNYEQGVPFSQRF
jgi:hypothetical protein